MMDSFYPTNNATYCYYYLHLNNQVYILLFILHYFEAITLLNSDITMTISLLNLLVLWDTFPILLRVQLLFIEFLLLFTKD